MNLLLPEDPVTSTCVMRLCDQGRVLCTPESVKREMGATLACSTTPAVTSIYSMLLTSGRLVLHRSMGAHQAQQTLKVGRRACRRGFADIREITYFLLLTHHLLRRNNVDFLVNWIPCYPSATYTTIEL